MDEALPLPEPRLWTLGAPGDGKVLTGIKPTAGFGSHVFTAGQVADAMTAYAQQAASAAVLQERERAAKIAEAMRPPGGRMWSEGQLACFEALTDCAAAIREGA